MPLVEIVFHSKSDPAVLKALYEWVRKVKKTPLLVKDGPGFLVNRILTPFMNEAAYLLEEGVLMEKIDEACRNFGMPMGPCRLADEVGIDVGAKVSKIIHAGVGDRLRPNSLMDKMLEKGALGKKVKRGFYHHTEGSKEVQANEAVLALLPKKKSKMDEVTIQKRIFLPMINEAAAALQDGIVSSAHEVDLGLIFGIGFPPFRGGLLRYADSEGVPRICEALNEYKREVSKERYAPVSYLEDLAKKNRKFYGES